MADLEFHVEGGVGTILLNRPQRKNAFTFDMLDEWAAVIRRSRRDDDVRVLLVTGAGGSFCAGVDLDEYSAARSTPLVDKTLLTDRVHQVAEALLDFDKPVVAAVQGVAIGAGMDMSLLADVRVACETARFSEGYVRVGLIPGDGGCFLLPRAVGMGRALELLWTGDTVDAHEALSLGIVNHVYPEHEFHERVAAYVARLAAGPPVAMRMIKRAAYQGATSDLRSALDLISSHQAIVQATQDSVEALAAFRERRLAVFEGR